MKAQQSARMEATQAFSLTNVCEGGDECNTGVRSEEPHNVKGERCDRPGGEVRPTECVFVCAVDFAVHVRCVLSAVGARCAVLRCAVLVRCAVCGASHFQGMLNKKHKQPRARSAEPARAAETRGAWGGRLASRRLCPGLSSGPPPASGLRGRARYRRRCMGNVGAEPHLHFINGCKLART
jgi:hypothetical protein